MNKGNFKKGSRWRLIGHNHVLWWGFDEKQVDPELLLYTEWVAIDCKHLYNKEHNLTGVFYDNYNGYFETIPINYNNYWAKLNE